MQTKIKPELKQERNSAAGRRNRSDKSHNKENLEPH